MSEACNKDCSSCNKEGCGEKNDLRQPMNRFSSVKKVIGVVSGKGGVGKSLVTSLLAAAVARTGKKVAILDADVTGPSIPKSFGVKEKAAADDTGLLPAVTKGGIKIMSVNLLLEDETAPVVWRGPVISGVINQFWTDVNWGEVDYMFVDMPPGTGDVALTVFQGLPVDAIVIVSTPQDLVQMIVKKAVNMAKMMNVKILGLIENMSYFKCPSCQEKHSVFGASSIDETAAEAGIPVLAKLPLAPDINALIDSGLAEKIHLEELDEFVKAVTGA